MAEVEPGSPAACSSISTGLTNVWSLDIVHGAVQTVRSVIKPDKLHNLGPVADVRGLVHELRGIEGSA
jgi:RNA polymerase sigma-70 factor (ECF subfamily)